MNEESKWIVKELDKKDFTHPDAIRAVKIWRVVHTDYGGYTDNEIDFHVFPDGHIAVSGNGDGQFIFLDVPQVELLKTLICG